MWTPPPKKKKYGKPTVSASGRYHKNRLVAAGRSTGDGAQLEIRQQSHLAARITPMKVESVVAFVGRYIPNNKNWVVYIYIYICIPGNSVTRARQRFFYGFSNCVGDRFRGRRSHRGKCWKSICDCNVLN